MIEQIWRLSKVQLCNLYGFNEIRFTKDKGKRNRYFILAAIWLMLIFMFIGYIGVMAAVFVKMGMGEIIPVYLYTMASILILFFTLFKAGSIIFDMNTYEMMISLPVKKSAIIISRFLTMYVTNMSMGIIIMVPGTVMYAIFARPGVLFYVFSLFGILVLPLIPVSIASAIGALITAISARMKSKSIVASFLTILFCLLWVLVSSLFSEGASKMSNEALQNLAVTISDQISRIYPPASWYSKAVVSGSFIYFLMLMVISAAVFFALTFILQYYFVSISSALKATSAKNNYKMQNLSTSTVVKALWKKEVKRYFASSVYVTNTMIGYILMTVMCVALFIVGPQKVETLMEIPHITTKLLPYIIGFFCVMSPTTASSISLEGKQWNMTKSLPLRNKDLLTSKVLLNLTIALPFYLISIMFALLALRPSFMDAVWIIFIPAVYILLSSEIGLTINLRFPVFNWENEVRVVKQGLSMLLTMLTGFILVGIPFGVTLLFNLPYGKMVEKYQESGILTNTDPSSVINAASRPENVVTGNGMNVNPVILNVIMGIVFLLFIFVSILLHRLNNKKNLINLGAE